MTAPVASQHSALSIGKAAKAESRLSVPLAGFASTMVPEQASLATSPAGLGRLFGHLVQEATNDPGSTRAAPSTRMLRDPADGMAQSPDTHVEEAATAASPLTLWMALPPLAELGTGVAAGVSNQDRPRDERASFGGDAPRQSVAPVADMALASRAIDGGRHADMKNAVRDGAQQATGKTPKTEPAPQPNATAMDAAATMPGTEATSFKAEPTSAPGPVVLQSVPQGYDVTQAVRSPEGRVTRLTIALRPEGLGELAVSVSQVDGRLQLDIRTEREDVAAALAADPAELMGTLTELLPTTRGIEIRISVPETGTGLIANWNGDKTASAGERAFGRQDDSHGPRLPRGETDDEASELPVAMAPIATQARVLI